MDRATRNEQAFLLYDSILSRKLREGSSFDEAKNSAFDAVELLFNISKKTLQNEMYRPESGRTSKSGNPAMFRYSKDELLSILRSANEDMQRIMESVKRLDEIWPQLCEVHDAGAGNEKIFNAAIERNKALIGLLEGMDEGIDRQ